MWTVARAWNVKEMKVICIGVLCINAAIFASGCQKNPSPELSAASAESSNSASGAVASAPTGIVKNATRHTEETANVTRWWDIAEKKTAIQTAREEKIAKEANELKLALDAKLAQDAKILAAKTAASTIALAKVPAAIVPAPVIAAKPVDLTPTSVAAIKPAATPVPEGLKFISGVQPTFPIAAARAGHTQGLVNARLFVEKNGSVSKVEIMDANPKKYFDKEVITALSAWKYAAISSPQTKIVEIQFKAEN